MGEIIRKMITTK